MSGPAQNHPSPNTEIDLGHKVQPEEEPPAYAQPQPYPTITAQPIQNDIAGGDTIVIVQHDKVEFGPEPMMTYCSQCRVQVQTRVDHECGLCAILVCILIFGICTYCCSCFKDVVHSCPHCGAFLGRYKRLDI